MPKSAYCSPRHPTHFSPKQIAMTIASFNQVTEYPVGLQTRRVLTLLSFSGRKAHH